MRLTEEQATLIVYLQKHKTHYLPIGTKPVVELSKLGLIAKHYAGNNKGACVKEAAVYYFVKPKGRGWWPIWAIEHFPQQGDTESCHKFEPMIWHYALHSKVLVVATTRIEGAWKAYCSTVPGFNHNLERSSVLAEGEPVCEELAKIMFSHMGGIPYAR